MTRKYEMKKKVGEFTKMKFENIIQGFNFLKMQALSI